MVGTVDAGGIIHRVRVQTAAGYGVFDTSALCGAQIGALADHLATQLVTINANGVVGPIAGIRMRFIRSLDIGADAAEPEEFDFGAQ